LVSLGAGSYSPPVSGRPAFQLPLRRSATPVDDTFVTVGTITVSFAAVSQPRRLRNPRLHLAHLATLATGPAGRSPPRRG
jgi:hypothetical protein